MEAALQSKDELIRAKEHENAEKDEMMAQQDSFITEMSNEVAQALQDQQNEILAKDTEIARRDAVSVFNLTPQQRHCSPAKIFLLTI